LSAAQVILTRFSRVGERKQYIVCTMIIMSELVKLVFSLALLGPPPPRPASALSLSSLARSCSLCLPTPSPLVAPLTGAAAAGLENHSLARAVSLIRTELLYHRGDCLKLLVPAGLYFVQVRPRAARPDEHDIKIGRACGSTFYCLYLSA
jgi:hypothetical protein